CNSARIDPEYRRVLTHAQHESKSVAKAHVFINKGLSAIHDNRPAEVARRRRNFGRSPFWLLTPIAICNIVITDCNMKLGEKIRYLREVEGALRGLDREMTQQEVVRAIKKELRQGISQSYLSQIEGGSRPHLTNSTRLL